MRPLDRVDTLTRAMATRRWTHVLVLAATGAVLVALAARLGTLAAVVVVALVTVAVGLNVASARSEGARWRAGIARASLGTGPSRSVRRRG